MGTITATPDADGVVVIEVVPDPTDLQYSWEGTPHASRSEKRINGVLQARNNLHNPSSEVTATFAANLVRCTASRTSGSGTVGTYQSRLETTATGGIFARSVLPAPVAPGTDYTARVAARSATGVPGRLMRMALAYLDSGGAIIGTPTYVDLGTLSTSWAVGAAAATAPTGAVDAQIIVRVDDAATGEVFYLDAAGVFATSTYDGTYFDGDTDDEPADAYTLTRTDANGTHEVRVEAGTYPITTTTTVTDYEAAHGEVTYDATTPGPGDAQDTITVTLPGPILSAPYTLTRVEPDLVTGLTATRPSTLTIHDVIDRPDPVVVHGVQRTRRGVLTMFFVDLAEALAAHALHTGAEPLQLRTPYAPGLDLYYVPTPTGASLRPATAAGQRWELEVEYVEVGHPTGAVQ